MKVVNEKHNKQFDSTKRNGHLSMNAFNIKSPKHVKQKLID